MEGLSLSDLRLVIVMSHCCVQITSVIFLSKSWQVKDLCHLQLEKIFFIPPKLSAKEAVFKKKKSLLELIGFSEK